MVGDNHPRHAEYIRAAHEFFRDLAKTAKSSDRRTEYLTFAKKNVAIRSGTSRRPNIVYAVRISDEGINLFQVGAPGQRV